MNIVDRIISPNIWDEEWELGNIGSYSSNLMSKNYIPVIPGLDYYFHCGSYNVNGYGLRLAYYDANKNLISNFVSYDVNNTIPSNVCFIKFGIQYSLYGQTYKNDICINESNPSINGKYFPYVMYKRYDMVDKPIYELPDGYIPTDIEVGGSYGIVDLGKLNWNYNSTYHFFFAGINTYNMCYRITPRLICSKYQTVETRYTSGGYTTNGITFLRDGNPNNGSVARHLNIKDSTYTDVTNFKNAMQGIYLIYERVTPASPTLVKGNELNKYCIYNGQIGVYGNDTFKYNSNIPLKQWLRRLKIGG